MSALPPWIAVLDLPMPATLGHVNCYLVHAARDFQGWNQVWKEYFPQNPPARTTVGADIAMAGALIEVELIALV